MEKQNCRYLVSRREFCAAAAGLGVAASCQKQEKAAGPRPAAKGPNVLLIVADDLNNALGCFGNSVVQSPNIDRLAKPGVRFERAHCQYPVCNPSRTSMLSGLRPERTGVMTNGTHVVADGKDAPLLPRFLRNQGYFTIRVGKIYHDSKRMLEGKALRTTDDPAGWDISEDEPINNEDAEDAASLREAQVGGELRRIVKSDANDDELGDGI